MKQILCEVSSIAVTKLPQHTDDKSGIGVHYVDAYLKGQKDGIPQHQYWPHILLTKDNIDSAAVKAYGLWGDEVANGQ